MKPSRNHKKYDILYVDEDVSSLRHFQQLLSPYFNVAIAPSAKEAWESFKQRRHHTAIVVADFSVAQNRGAELLLKMRGQNKALLLLMTTRYPELEKTIEAVQQYGFYHYLQKPWNSHNLVLSLQRAMDYFLAQQKQKQVDQQKWSDLHRTLIMDRILSLHVFATGLCHTYRDTIAAVESFIALDHFNGNYDPERSPVLNEQVLDQLFFQMNIQTRHLNDLLQFGNTSSNSPACKERFASYDLKTRLENAMKLFLRTFSSKKFRITLHWEKGLNDILTLPTTYDHLLRVLFQTVALYLSEGALVRIHVFKKVSATPSSLCLLISGRSHAKPYEGTRSLVDPLRTWNPKTQQLGLHLLSTCILCHHLQGQIHYQTKDHALPEGLALTFPLKPRRARPGQSSAMDWDHLMANGSLKRMIPSFIEA